MLVVSWMQPAFADDDTERKAKRAERVLASLDSLGIQNSNISHLVRQVSDRTEKGYIYLTQEEMANGRVALRYDTGMPNVKRMELAYTSDDKRTEIVASTRGVMFRYKYAFPIK